MNKQHEIEAVTRHHNLFFGNMPVRVIVDEHGQPWWVAQDICEILSIQWNGAKSLAGLDADEWGKTPLANATGHLRETLVLSESGLYTLTIRSHKPQAKPFRKWVTSEVLPSIRRTGSYTAPAAEQITDPAQANLLLTLTENTSRMFDLMGKTLERLDARLARLEQAPPPTAPAVKPKLASYGALQVAGFVSACCRATVLGACRKDVLYSHYQRFCREGQMDAFSYNGFFALLYRATGVRQARRHGGSRRHGLICGIVPLGAPRQRTIPGVEEQA